MSELECGQVDNRYAVFKSVEKCICNRVSVDLITYVCFVFIVVGCIL